MTHVDDRAMRIHDTLLCLEDMPCLGAQDKDQDRRDIR